MDVRSVLHPAVLEHLLGGEALLDVELEHIPDQLLGIAGDVVPPRRREVVPRVKDLVEERRQFLLVKGREAAEEDVQDHPCGPDVDSARVVALVLQDLGGNVPRSPTGRLHHIFARDHPRKAKVRNLDRVRVRRLVQDVLRLEVAVDNLLVVQKVQRLAQLGHAAGRLLLGVLLFLHDSVKELAARHQLHDEVHLFGLIVDLEERDDILVLHHLHDLNLALRKSRRPRLRPGFDGGGLPPSETASLHASSWRR
mmetsp:Transcript_12135/g.38929  ORF Transcript_12135/g.38929 Transcript_12135/m.38929 type:complete len:253 (-) Transcript_12135:307-1065(-)